MDPTIGLRIKALDVGIPLLRIEFEVKAVEHNSSVHFTTESNNVFE